jgi:hypothetical protein
MWQMELVILLSLQSSRLAGADDSYLSNVYSYITIYRHNGDVSHDKNRSLFTFVPYTLFGKAVERIK